MNETIDSQTPPAETIPGKPAMKRKGLLRRKFILLLVVLVICYFLFNPFKPRVFRTNKKLIILGFDGTDPDLVNRWMDELPNLKKLAGQGSHEKLKTSTPPESPVAWSCFAIGANPGKHGVFDFLRRPSGCYSPSVEAFVKREYPKFLFNSIPIKLPRAILRRGGTAFWDVLSQHGVRTSMIEVPVTFPPPTLYHGRALSGLGVPDIRGQQATFHHFVYDANNDAVADQETTFGGKVESLHLENGVYTGNIYGPYDPIIDSQRREKEKERLDVIVTFYEWNAHLMHLQGQHVTGEQKMVLAEELNMNVYGSMAYMGYLYSKEVEARADRIRMFLKDGTAYEKTPGANASKAREEMAKSIKRRKELDEEILKLSKPILVPVHFKIVDKNTVQIEVQGQKQETKLHEWSDWFGAEFKVNSLIVPKAVFRFYVQEISNSTLKVFMTSPDIDPRHPIIPVSYPNSYSKELAQWLGEPYKTRGWAAETHGLKDGHLDEEGFLKDLNFVMDLREKKLFETWDRTNNNVLISVFSETDRIAHMFYRLIDKGHPMYDAALAEKYEDAMKDIYKRMDVIVGKVMKRIENDPDTTLIVMSDHGFSSWRYQVNLNDWLCKHSFMDLKPEFKNKSELSSNKKLEDLLKKSDFFEPVEWHTTKAYSLGLGQIYLNLKGREPLGIVDPKEYDKICDAIIQELEGLTDDRPGRNNAKVIDYVKKRTGIWKGKFANDDGDCPDLQVGFMPGYRVSWQTCLGGFDNAVITDNMEKWSGDHCSLSSNYVPGMFFSNKKINSSTPSIYDFGPTVLGYFGLPVPSEMEGKNLFD